MRSQAFLGGNGWGFALEGKVLSVVVFGDWLMFGCAMSAGDI
jgi:hypothetical protein